MTRTDEEIQKVLLLTLSQSYVEFKSDSPESDRQKLYRIRKQLSDESPLLWYNEIVVRIRDDNVIIEWKNPSKPIEINTERREPLEIRTSPPKPKKPAFKWPKWLEDKKNGFVEFRHKALDMGPEYRGAWEQLDTLVAACDHLAEVIEQRRSDPELERFIRSADLKDALVAFTGEREIEEDPIEILRLQIAEIPTDDHSRDDERLRLIERREKLMLERDIRLQHTSPLD